MTTRRPIQFGKYLLLDRIAIGGMAEIFRAKTSGAARFEKIIAIKRIHPNMSDDKDFIKMFIDEAKISGQLNHPSIAQIYELGRIEGHHFIAMEFIWGKDLLQILSKFKKQRAYMNPFQAAFIISKICEGLDYAHKKKDAQGQSIGIIHRDVSPQNILISYEGDIKIIDFGIAKARDRSSHTAAGVLKGKFGYMSPEQIRGLPIDHRSDIFAIGTLLFEMLTSRPLFTGESDLTVLEKVRNVDIPKPRGRGPLPARIGDAGGSGALHLHGAADLHQQAPGLLDAEGLPAGARPREVDPRRDAGRRRGAGPGNLREVHDQHGHVSVDPAAARRRAPPGGRNRNDRRRGRP
jgi:serine/threonine protein kinase